MTKKLEAISPEFHHLVDRAIKQGFLIEGLCLIIQFFEYSCFIIFHMEFYKKTKIKNAREKFKNEFISAEKNSSFLVFTLFAIGLLDYELYRGYTVLKKKRNNLVHNLVKKSKIEYDKQGLIMLINDFFKRFSAFFLSYEIPKDIV